MTITATSRANKEPRPLPVPVAAARDVACNAYPASRRGGFRTIEKVRSKKKRATFDWSVKTMLGVKRSDERLRQERVKASRFALRFPHLLARVPSHGSGRVFESGARSRGGAGPSVSFQPVGVNPQISAHTRARRTCRDRRAARLHRCRSGRCDSGMRWIRPRAFRPESSRPDVARA